MSKLKELIDRLCPDGVEYSTLGKVADIRRGVRVVKSNLATEGDIPVYQNSLTPLGYYTKSNFPADTAFVIGAGAAGEIGYSAIPYWGADDCYSIICSSKIISKYVYYQLANNQIFLKSRVRTASIPRLARTAIEQFPIAIPPIEVQEEIVKILDRFADYAAELQAELQARKEQYEYYRNLLLTFNPSACGCGTDGAQEIKVTTWGGDIYEIIWKTIGEICSLSRGKVYSKDYLRNNPGEYPVYSSQTTNNGELGRISTYDIDGEYLSWTTDGAYAGSIFFRSGKFNITNVCGLIRPSKIIDIHFLHHWLTLQAPKHVYQGMGNPKLMSNQMAEILVPVLPIKLQEKIASILDRFETLVNDLTHGLPAEIAAVKEQYEYYRNKLLTFKKAS